MSQGAARGAYRGPGCPHCAAALPGEAAGPRHLCRSCGLEFQLARFQPAVAAIAAVRPVDAAAGAACARHERNAAVATCERCGAFMCSLCRIDVDGKALCAACFDRLGKAGALASARTGYRHYNGIALTFSILGAVAFFSAPILGPLAIFTGLKGLKQSRELGEELGTSSAKFAVGLGALETLAAVIAALALFGRLR